MEPTKPKISVKDFFLNLGATISLYTVVITLVMLLFTIINVAYPQVVNGYVGSSSISWPVAILFVFTPVLILLMWLLERQYKLEPERKTTGIHKWIMYATLFLAGLAMAGDLITVLYYFIDGQELNKAFLLKCLALLIVSSGLFGYYISDIREKLTHGTRIIWRAIAVLAVIGAISWGFSVLGTPQTQRLYKYDDNKVSDLMNIDSAIQNYYGVNNLLPKNFDELATLNYYINRVDSQSQKEYEYVVKSKLSYELCADFNKEINNKTNVAVSYPYGGPSWTHPAGRYCFVRAVNPAQVPGMKI